MGWFGSLCSSIGSAISSCCSAIGSFIGSCCETFISGCSLVISGISDALKEVGEGIKSICESLGSTTMLLVGAVALSILLPELTITQILEIVELIGKIAELFNISEDKPEEVGMKAEIAPRKPEDFDSIQEYIDYLNTEVELEEGASVKLSAEDRVKYGAIGASLEMLALMEKFNVAITPEFLRDVATLKLSEKEVGAYIQEFSERGISNMQDMTNYLRNARTESDNCDISGGMFEAMKKLYPELSAAQREAKMCQMEETLRASINEG